MTSTIQQRCDHTGRFAYLETGTDQKGHAPTLVLLHGVGMQSAAWGPQLTGLAQDRHIIALDLPGHGHSLPLEYDAHLPEFVNWLHHAVEALELNCIALAGHSMGALIAGGFAASYIDLVDRVALLNPVFKRNAQQSSAVIARAANIQNGCFDIETPLMRWFGETPIEQQARRHVSKWLSAVDLSGYATAYRAFAHGDATYADRYQRIGGPLLALTGAGDPNSTPAMSQEIAHMVPLGRAIIIENHRHMVNLTAPDRVNDALNDWLAMPKKKVTAA